MYRYRYRYRYKKASDPLSSMIEAGLDAINKAVERFVTSEMNQVMRFIRKMQQR